MSETARVKVLLLVGDQAEIVADAPDPAQPIRYPAAEIAAAAGIPVEQLPGARLLADVADDDTLSGWRPAS
ncbi:hypothetical protein LN042_11455 [Kitasatospora sp. RB6PN24]|uniref:hypothetical protein n=1 Tax=Kitasatospora humi TaxID=2893891 RepID=UPI001E5C1509|nr:hypothetical protein [Kitasatospora humi]MCC9307705.1 hypothetical protein [Kitasatospora humi]